MSEVSDAKLGFYDSHSKVFYYVESIEEFRKCCEHLNQVNSRTIQPNDHLCAAWTTSRISSPSFNKNRLKSSKKLCSRNINFDYHHNHFLMNI